MPINVRPRRSARIRTRLPLDEVMERIRAVAGAAPPEGFARFTAHGYFLDGQVGDREFHADYRFNSAKNPQTYAVHGTVEDTSDWRIVRVKIRAREPWMGGEG